MRVWKKIVNNTETQLYKQPNMRKAINIKAYNDINGIPEVSNIIYQINVSKNEGIAIHEEIKRKSLINGLKSLLDMYHYIW